ncbi:MAG: response regulator transcription factor [Henriciella sp.]|nr:response regulator transcription factor [Henriciella sp.]
MTTLALVDDDENIVASLKIFFEAEGYDVRTYHDGLSALGALTDSPPDIAILDVKMPKMDGMEVCSRLRAVRPTMSILMLTARASEDDKVAGLCGGADDYLTKPVGYRELVARVRAHLRRSALSVSAKPAHDQVSIGELRLDPLCRKAHFRKCELALTAREYDLLLLFAKNSGVVFSRDDLLGQVWGIAYDGYEHTVNSHINRLRGKLTSCGADKDLVETVWGGGDRMKEQEL